MKFVDKILTCVDCGKQFVFSAGEQMFFSLKGLENERKHCNQCRAKRVHLRPRPDSSVICAACGAPTIVPFVPHQERPVLCRPCFDAARARWIADCGDARASVSEQVEAVE